LLGKPYNLDELAHAVRDALTGRRGNDAAERHAHPGSMSVGHAKAGASGKPGPVIRETV
jgi:hypothetical protein